MISAPELPRVLTEKKERPFGGPECNPGDCPSTVHSVASICADVIVDDKHTLNLDEPVDGPGIGVIASSYRVPAELTNFHYAAMYLSDPVKEGQGWTTCYVYFSYEDGRPVVAGMGWHGPGL